LKSIERDGCIQMKMLYEKSNLLF